MPAIDGGTEAQARPRGQARGDRTRQALIDAAFQEIHLNGYRAASLSSILAAAGCTKGSLYHHFPDKHALGLAAARTHIDRYLDEVWITPLASTEDPVREIKQIIERIRTGKTPYAFDVTTGCPLNNLGQEMSGIDPDFSAILNDAISKWREALSEALANGQRSGKVDPAVDPCATAAVIVAMHQGTIGILKTSQDLSLGEVCARGFYDYLEKLRPPVSGPNQMGAAK